MIQGDKSPLTNLTLNFFICKTESKVYLPRWDGKCTHSKHMLITVPVLLYMRRLVWQRQCYMAIKSCYILFFFLDTQEDHYFPVSHMNRFRSCDWVLSCGKKWCNPLVAWLILLSHMIHCYISRHETKSLNWPLGGHWVVVVYENI